MAAGRHDGTDENGWVLEQGGRFYQEVTIVMASPNVTAAGLRIRETLNSTSDYLNVTQNDYISIANNASSAVLTINIPGSVTAALTGELGSYYYDLEMTEGGQVQKVLYGYIPWRREPGGAT